MTNPAKEVLEKILTRVNRKYKDSLFCDLFSIKEHALSLYNAVNGTHYTDSEELEIVTLSDAVFIHQKNDVSILFDSRLTLWEHQSTLNANMPLRGLLYYARNMEGILSEVQKNRLIYQSAVVKIPTPAYYVFYNGASEQPERMDLKLSEAFLTPSDGYEWTAHFLNINKGHNEALLQACPALMGYSEAIGRSREYLSRGMSCEQAVDKALEDCIQEGYLSDYFSKIRGEARQMLWMEFDENGFRDAVREEGREEGRAEERANTERERERAERAEAALAEANAKIAELTALLHK
ncbi:MAG: hypothetical protein IKS07_00505 [Lachnospiraceae bacterium]|nr:hypothetical protein [Lachnospiraceae bacterium]